MGNTNLCGGTKEEQVGGAQITMETGIKSSTKAEVHVEEKAKAKYNGRLSDKRRAELKENLRRILAEGIGVEISREEAKSSTDSKVLETEERYPLQISDEDRVETYGDIVDMKPVRFTSNG